MKKLLTLFTLLLCVCSGVWADDISDYATGFEENATTNYDKGECGSIVVSTDAPRTGGYCLSTVYTGGTGNKRWYPKATFAVPQNSYFHIIGYAKLLSSDVTGESSSTQAYADAYVGTAKAGAAVNLTTSWKRVYSTSGKASSNKTGAQARFYRKHTNKLAVLFDDVIAYVSTNSEIDLTAPTSATSANATVSAISWTVGADANTGIQKTLIFKRTSGSADDLTLNDQGIYSLTPTEGPSTDQSGHWTLVAVVNGDATSYEEALDGSTRYAIVHRDLAYNYSTPTYVTTPSTGAYTITKSDHANGDFTISSSSADKDAVITLSATPNDGFAFNSWKIHKTGYVEQTIEPESNTANTTFTMPDFNVTVKAYFAAIPFNITHTAAEHGTYTIRVASEEPVSENTVGYIGQTVYLVATPDDGYVLKAWNVTETLSGNAVTMISDNAFDMPTVDVTIAPEFEAVYTVTLNPNGGTINAGNVTEYVEGTGATLPTNVTKDCYTFAGWYDNSGLTGVAVTTISTEATGNKEYWAKWTPKYATSLNFQAVVEAGTQASNPIATFLSNANMEHSTFSSSVWETGDAPSSEYVGFKLKDNGAYVKFLVKAGKEVTITLGNIAQTLELYKNGVKTNIAASTGAGVQTVVPAFTPAEDMLVELRTTNTGTVTLKKIIIDEKFDVTYKANGSGEADVVNNVSKVDENMFTYAGHSFTGWNTQADGNGTDYAVGADVTSELTLFAQWTEHIAPTYGSLFSLSFVNSSKVTMSDGDNLDLTSTYATITGGSAMISYFKDGNNNKDVLTSNNEITYGTNDMYLKLTLNYPLQAGDVISFANGSGPQLSIATTAGTPKDQSSKVTTTSYSYTVEADDALDGKKVLYVGRSDASTTKHKAITINRPASVTITDLSAIDGSTYTGKNYATLYYGDNAIAVPAGVKAYTYKMDAGNLVISRTYEKGGTYPVIPAGEAVVLETETGASYNFNMATTATTVDTESLLAGSDAETTVDATGYKYYKLSMNDDLNKVGFYFAVAGGASITNGAHKAYLAVPDSGDAKNFFVLGGEDEDNNETTAINVVDIAIANGATIYNLAGQKVGANYKGIVVINGKKVVRK